MTHEAPAQRRTRLIEQFMIHAYADAHVQFSIAELLKYAQELADAVIAATPQEPQPTRYPSEAETRLIELVERAVDEMRIGNLGFAANEINNVLRAIKRDLGLV